MEENLDPYALLCVLQQRYIHVYAHTYIYRHVCMHVEDNLNRYPMATMRAATVVCVCVCACACTTYPHTCIHTYMYCAQHIQTHIQIYTFKHIYWGGGRILRHVGRSQLRGLRHAHSYINTRINVRMYTCIYTELGGAFYNTSAGPNCQGCATGSPPPKKMRYQSPKVKSPVIRIQGGEGA